MRSLKTILTVFILIFSNASNAFSTKATHALLIDADTNEVLFQKNANAKMHPSSMSKLMSVYALFDMLKQKHMSLTDSIKVSTKAWKAGGSKMFLAPNSTVSVEDIIRGIIVQSGNDACIALAESIGGTEEEFVNRMNSLANEIGLKNSKFVNSTGFPHQHHYMSSFDLAILATKLIETFPEYYRYFAETEFTYNNITQPNRNTLLKREMHVDGLKTGHTNAGGYGIVASASKNGRRLILVINGLKSEKEREEEAISLLQYGTLNFTNIVVGKAGETLAKTHVINGDKSELSLTLNRDLVITVPIVQKNKLKAKLIYSSNIKAPITKGLKLGVIELYLPNSQLKSYDVYAAEEVKTANFIKTAWSKLMSGKNQLELSTVSKDSSISGDRLVFF